MSSLKDALKKAGIQSSKSENMREKKRGRAEVQQSEKHQLTRNFCEVCELIQPDVERFKHRNPTVDAEWICVACADRASILDQFRITNQSDFAKRKRYRREFGATKDASEFSMGRGDFKKPARGSNARGSGHNNSDKKNGNTSGQNKEEKNFNR